MSNSPPLRPADLAVVVRMQQPLVRVLALPAIIAAYEDVNFEQVEAWLTSNRRADVTPEQVAHGEATLRLIRDTVTRFAQHRKDSPGGSTPSASPDFRV